MNTIGFVAAPHLLPSPPPPSPVPVSREPRQLVTNDPVLVQLEDSGISELLVL